MTHAPHGNIIRGKKVLIYFVVDAMDFHPANTQRSVYQSPNAVVALPACAPPVTNAILHNDPCTNFQNLWLQCLGLDHQLFL